MADGFVDSAAGSVESSSVCSGDCLRVSSCVCPSVGVNVGESVDKVVRSFVGYHVGIDDKGCEVGSTANVNTALELMKICWDGSPASDLLVFGVVGVHVGESVDKVVRSFVGYHVGVDDRPDGEKEGGRLEGYCKKMLALEEESVVEPSEGCEVGSTIKVNAGLELMEICWDGSPASDLLAAGFVAILVMEAFIGDAVYSRFGIEVGGSIETGNEAGFGKLTFSTGDTVGMYICCRNGESSLGISAEEKFSSPLRLLRSGRVTTITSPTTTSNNRKSATKTFRHSRFNANSYSSSSFLLYDPSLFQRSVSFEVADIDLPGLSFSRRFLLVNDLSVTDKSDPLVWPSSKR
jgi:hypothetical protein